MQLDKFSKVADLKIPDSPPPEQQPDSDADDPKKGMGKFERMMKAAVSIKSQELEGKRRKFEKLPMFLKAGVYYSQKLEAIREQGFFPKVFAFEIIKREAEAEFAVQNFDRACRKFEEALSVFRYYVCLNARWNEEGINDADIQPREEFGATADEQRFISQAKLQVYLAIAACNIKTKEFATAVAACDEALALDPASVRALYRRARARALPINSGVEDFREALQDLRRVLELDPGFKPAAKEAQRLQALVEVNRRRERDIYSRMFAGGVSDHLSQKPALPNYQTLEEREFERERQKLDRKVAKMLAQKEFSFEEKAEKAHFKEVDDVQEMIAKAEESYRLLRKTGRLAEAKAVKAKLLEAKYAKAHLERVMNLDFDRPTQRMRETARRTNIDLRDPAVLAEFRKIQQQNLEDVRRLKEGKPPLSDQELQQKLRREREQLAKNEATLRILEETEREKDRSMRDLIESTLSMQRSNEEKLRAAAKTHALRHYLVLGAFLCVWVGFILLQNR